MAEVGRPSLYHKQVEPFLDKVEVWLNQGATEKKIAEALNVSYSSWNTYKTQFKALKDICDKPRLGLVLDLRGNLVKAATGFTYEEKKTYIKKDADGKESKYTEITQKYQPPSVTAIFGALNLYDDEYVKDKKAYELKREELELKKELAKEELW